MSARRRVLVTDAGRASSLAVIRSLGRAGHQVVAVDPSRRAAGTSSRYATAVDTYPSPFDATAAETAAAIADLAFRHDVDVIIPVTDDVILPLQRHRPVLPKDCIVACAPTAAVDAAASKVATWRLADSLGIAQPAAEVLENPSDASGLFERLGTPVVLKPDRSRIEGSDGRLVKGPVTYAWTEADVLSAIRRTPQRLLAQAYHPGTGYGVGMVAVDGRPVLAVVHRRLHEVPLSGGASAKRETVAPEAGLIEPATAILRALRWTGAAMVEFKVGPLGTALMEVNGRLWGSLPLAVRAGCDIPGMLLGVHTGDPESLRGPLDTRYRRHVVARNLDLELRWIGSVLAHRTGSTTLVTVPRRAGFDAIGDLLRTKQGDDLMASDDLRPVLAGVRNAVGHAVRKVGSRG